MLFSPVCVRRVEPVQPSYAIVARACLAISVLSPSPSPSPSP